MRRRLVAPILVFALFATGCAHPEDRRWTAMSPVTSVPDGEQPSVSVYAFAPPKPGGRTGVRDLSDQGQAALIEAMARTPADAAALRKALATPLEGEAGAGGAVDRSRLARTIVISVRKGPDSLPGDRLMRTVVTLTPHVPADEDGTPFEFAGYSVVATDTKIQNISQLETTTEASLSASVAPKIGGFGDNSLGGEISNTRKTSADIVQQYENLGVDITPAQMIITRESERGLDVVGNTLVALTLAAPSDSERGHSAYLAGTTKLFDKGVMLSATAASLEIQPFSFFARCDLKVDVELRYQLRRIDKGREYYTEGKQTVEVMTGTLRAATQTLVRAADAQGALYQLLDGSGSAVLVSHAGSDTRRLLFDSFDDAKRMATWLGAARRQTVGTHGPALSINGQALPRGGQYRADFYSVGCPIEPAAPER